MTDQEETHLSELSGHHVRSVAAIVVAIALLVPMFTLPRPVNVSSIPWKAEAAFSLCLIFGLLVYRKSFQYVSITNNIRNAAGIAALLAVFSLLSAFWSASWFATLHSAFSWLTYSVLLIFVFLLSNTARGLDLVIRVFAAIALILGTLILFDFATLVDFATQEGVIRIRYAKFAEMLITFAPIFFAVALYRRRPAGFAFAMVPGIFAWVTVMLSLSKGAFLSGLIGFVVFFSSAAILTEPRFRKRIAAGFVIWLAITVAVQTGFTYFSSVPSTVDYISGDADTSRSTTSMRIFNWNLTWLMFKHHPLFGVGSDNFGLNVNEIRAKYAEQNPDDDNNAIGEDYVFERSHSEPLQILAELGIVGIAVFMALVVFVVFVLANAAFRSKGRCSPIFLAAISGCLAFAASSLFSSFSFRAFQNGVVFFAVLALAFRFIPIGERSTVRSIGKVSGAGSRDTLMFRLSAVCVLIFLIYSTSKGIGHYSAFFAERAHSAEESQQLFEASLYFDPDLSGSHLALAGRASKRGKHSAAAQHYRNAIDGGFGISLIYSHLSAAYQSANEMGHAEASLREGISIFPRSMFLRARLVEVLSAMERHSDAEHELEIARSIDEKQANGWNAVLTDGILAAHLIAQKDTSFAKPPDLLPSAAIVQYSGGFAQLPVATP